AEIAATRIAKSTPLENLLRLRVAIFDSRKKVCGPHTFLFLCFLPVAANYAYGLIRSGSDLENCAGPHPGTVRSVSLAYYIEHTSNGA
uniref:Uncharacterized protein n=1 Tax=Romanomermis culicivorax TaxID=13658 RepID=A0A915JX96_ROMCU